MDVGWCDVWRATGGACIGLSILGNLILPRYINTREPGISVVQRGNTGQ